MYGFWFLLFLTKLYSHTNIIKGLILVFVETTATHLGFKRMLKSFTKYSYRNDPSSKQCKKISNIKI